MNSAFLPLVALLVIGASVPQGRGGAPSDAKAKPDPGAKVAKEDDLATVYFGIADHDENGWISFTEATRSLRIDRAAFAVYDQDRDGRISPAEFARRYEQITARGGAFAAPERKPDAKRPARRTPAELLDEFDTDDDKALDAGEVARALEAHGVRDLDGETALTKIDRNASKTIEKAELAELVEALSPARKAAARVRPASIFELFGKKEVIEDPSERTPGPARIQGPVSPFERLDADADGRISTRDLVELQRPIQISIRVNAVVATLDRDGDGEISPDEFADSMR